MTRNNLARVPRPGFDGRMRMQIGQCEGAQSVGEGLRMVQQRLVLATDHDAETEQAGW